MEGGQRPLELILARNLLASLSTPAFLVDGRGEIAFYNEAAGAVLGRRYEDSGPMPADEWTRTFGPLRRRRRIRSRSTELGLTRRAAGATAPRTTASASGRSTAARATVEVSGLPIVGAGGYRGAMVVFWPAEEEVA